MNAPRHLSATFDLHADRLCELWQDTLVSIKVKNPVRRRSLLCEVSLPRKASLAHLMTKDTRSRRLRTFNGTICAARINDKDLVSKTDACNAVCNVRLLIFREDQDRQRRHESFLQKIISGIELQGSFKMAAMRSANADGAYIAAAFDSSASYVSRRSS